MNVIGTALNKVTKPLRNGDRVDRWNHKITPYLLFTAGAITFTLHYGGSPMHCWPKGNWDSPWKQYAADFCFIDGTRYVNTSELLPNRHDLEDMPKMNFYQWLPFIFALMGFIALAPRYLWKAINDASYLCLKECCDMAVDKFRKTTDASNPALLPMYDHLLEAFERKHPETAIVNRSHMNLVINFWNRFISNKFLTLGYLFGKVLNIIVIFVLLQMLNVYVANQRDLDFGFNVITKLLNLQTWEHTGFFPRVSICNFDVRIKGDTEESTLWEHHIAQCVLVYHMVVEKVFILIWFWLVAVQALNFYSLAAWMYAFTPFSSWNYVDELVDYCVLFPRDIAPEPLAEIKAKYNHLTTMLDDIAEHSGKYKYDETFQALKDEYDEEEAEYKALVERQMETRCTEIRAFNSRKDELLSDFLKFIGSDGILALRMFEANASTRFASITASKLFWKFSKSYKAHSEPETPKSEETFS
uniref:Innexin n=1 Tax=Panagrellus redivivus TaxID=6233 RepID=A0A7E4V9P4_PANRE